jgi:hypothetical protein
MKMEQSVPKRRHIKFGPRGITKKETYNIIYSILKGVMLVTKQVIIPSDLQAASYLQRSMSKSAAHIQVDI